MTTATMGAPPRWSPHPPTLGRRPTAEAAQQCALTDVSEPLWSDQPLTIAVASLDQLAGLQQAVSTLAKLLDLPAGWDSYGASPIRLAAVASALKLLAIVAGEGTPAPSIVPAPDGGVQFEWHTTDADLELAIDGFGGVDVFLDMHDGETREGPLAAERWGLARFLAYVTRRS